MGGFGISKETLALDLIDEAGPGGNFLQAKHTFEHFRREIWISDLLDRRRYDSWVSKGQQGQSCSGRGRR